LIVLLSKNPCEKQQLAQLEIETAELHCGTCSALNPFPILSHGLLKECVKGGDLRKLVVFISSRSFISETGL
jgi:hypothetical protein